MTDVVGGLVQELDQQLAEADSLLESRYPGDRVDRQPVHTVYVPADRFSATTVREWGDEALRLLDAYAPDAATLARATGHNEGEVADVYAAVHAKLTAEPVEDLRVDLEDGYGRRPDDIEDGHLRDTVAGLKAMGEDGTRPPWFGIRFKCFEAPTRERGVKTLAAFVEAFADGGALPDGFTLTLPKVTSVAQVEAMVTASERLEQAYGLDSGAIGFEIQVETAQAIMAADGTAAVASMIHAAQGRATSLHYGTFDYSAGLGIAAAYQSLDHPAADHAKFVMQLAAAQTGVRMSDGSTNVIRFGSAEQAAATWRLHANLVDRSLVRGIYQGWDMHPGHLVSRYLATYLFFRGAMPDACARLKAYVAKIEGDVMDEPATARMLSHALLRGMRCGAIDPDAVSTATGLDDDGLVALTR
jgi:HpcH/HpaI aldolase/citrate lyase family